MFYCPAGIHEVEWPVNVSMTIDMNCGLAFVRSHDDENTLIIVDFFTKEIVGAVVRSS